MNVGLVDSAQPGGYFDFRDQWSRAHILLPVAGLVGAVVFRWLERLTARGAGA